MSDDEYDEYDLSEFTEQDFASIDAAIAIKHSDSPKPNPSPAIQIEFEHSQPRPEKRPIDFLSWKKYFSVTDLVSPVWCEVQHEYGLYGRRNRPVERRPSSFTSKNGKVISVHQDTAQTNDKRLKRGKSVHQALEDELRPVKITVRTVSAEDRFGLRLVQLIDGFRELALNGITRELPVFTITHGQVIQGIIDEILRSSPSHETHDVGSISPPKKMQRCSPAPLDGHSSADDQTELPQEQSESNVGSSFSTNDAYALRIIDYKTRLSRSVPPEDQTLSSRLQLMLYHRMLTSVLQPESFDFDLLWSRLGLDATQRFSDNFLQDINGKGQTDTVDCPVNLSGLVQVWISTVHSEREGSGLSTVSPRLQLVYRQSAHAGKTQGKGKQRARECEEMGKALEALQEDSELARAIEESLRQITHHEADDVPPITAQMSEQHGPSSISHVSNVWKELLSPSSEQPDWQLELALQESLLTAAHQKRVETPGTTSLPPADTLTDGPSVDKNISRSILPEAPESTSAISPIIGSKEFEMDDDQLDTHLADVLQWWFGARPARGVDASQTNRCLTCEYRTSCEWREQKAREAAMTALECRAHRNDVTSA